MYMPQPQTPYIFQNIVGNSRAMQALFKLIERVAPSNATVLIQGENGTGKELVASAIHMKSHRRDRPFVAINCAAFAETLVESELFGHEKGAFTGANATRKGRFEIANGGTLFLDEVGEVSKFMQVKLLRVLQERKFERVGGNGALETDVRIIAASNKSLKTGVKEDWFREDLFYRLNVINIILPPLRDRKEDIPLLVDHFISKHSRKNGKRATGITCDGLDFLMEYPFPGNIRELENIIERAVVLATGRKVEKDDLCPQESVWAYDEESSGVKEDELLDVLMGIKVKQNGKPPKPWHKSVRCIKLDKIHEFLVRTRCKQFSRTDFAYFLKTHARFGKNKYKTAGDYLGVLIENNVCIHNGEKANQSGFRLSDAFKADE